MLIVMRHGATPDEVQKVISVIEELGYQAQPMPGNQRTAVGLVGNDGRVDASRLEGLPGVAEASGDRDCQPGDVSARRASRPDGGGLCRGPRK